MRLKNVLIVTEDIERAKKFYKDLFGLNVILDQTENAVLTEGLVLQDKKIWEAFIEKEIVFQNHASELYFEEIDIESFIEKLETYDVPVHYVTLLTEYPWGQKMVRFYDPDGNLIEVRTPM